ncbi:DUF21 domain-containing protein [Capsicum annuum]|nr:DUF21 domain-containing protein [Capsicum annuum]
MIMMTKETKGTLERPIEDKTGLENRQKRRCSPSALGPSALEVPWKRAQPAKSGQGHPKAVAYALGMPPICARSAPEPLHPSNLCPPSVEAIEISDSTLVCGSHEDRLVCDPRPGNVCEVFKGPQINGDVEIVGRLNGNNPQIAFVDDHASIEDECYSEVMSLLRLGIYLSLHERFNDYHGSYSIPLCPSLLNDQVALNLWGYTTFVDHFDAWFYLKHVQPWYDGMIECANSNPHVVMILCLFVLPLVLQGLDLRSNPFQEGEDDTSQMAFGLLERMLTGQIILEDFLRDMERCPLDDYDDKGDSRDVREANGKQNEARNPPKEEMWFIRFGELGAELSRGCALAKIHMSYYKSLPIFLDKLVPSWAAILVSVTLILMFGEIVPQSIYTRNGLTIGATLAPLVQLLLWLFFPIAYPISKVLDWMLGKGHASLLRRAELKMFVDLHGNEAGKGGDLTHDETTIIVGALKLMEKTAKDAMTPISKAFSLDLDGKLNLWVY